MSEMSYTAWIGRTQESQEELSTLLVSRLAATLGEPAPAAGEALPPLWHWAFFQDAVPEAGPSPTCCATASAGASCR